MSILTKGEVVAKLRTASLGDLVDANVGRDGWIELTVYAPDTAAAANTMASVEAALRGVTNVDINLDYIPMAEPTSSGPSGSNF